VKTSCRQVGTVEVSKTEKGAKTYNSRDSLMVRTYVPVCQKEKPKLGKVIFSLLGYKREGLLTKPPPPPPSILRASSSYGQKKGKNIQQQGFAGGHPPNY
jgi:hypothetical protein